MLPIDLTSLLVLAGVLIGLVAGNAAMYGDTLSLRIGVSQKLAQNGFDSSAAEQLFQR